MCWVGGWKEGVCYQLVRRSEACAVARPRLPPTKTINLTYQTAAKNCPAARPALPALLLLLLLDELENMNSSPTLCTAAPLLSAGDIFAVSGQIPIG